jgi:hypothetical protein
VSSDGGDGGFKENIKVRVSVRCASGPKFMQETFVERNRINGRLRMIGEMDGGVDN